MIPIQLLTLGHTVRVCYDLTNYAELSINSNGDLTIHKLVGGSPKIIDKTVTDETFTIPPTDRPLKVGANLVAINEDYGYTKWKSYPILRFDDNDDLNIIVEDDFLNVDYFSTDEKNEYYYKNYFTLKP